MVGLAALFDLRGPVHTLEVADKLDSFEDRGQVTAMDFYELWLRESRGSHRMAAGRLLARAGNPTFAASLSSLTDEAQEHFETIARLLIENEEEFRDQWIGPWPTPLGRQVAGEWLQRRRERCEPSR